MGLVPKPQSEGGGCPARRETSQAPRASRMAGARSNANNCWYLSKPGSALRNVCTLRSVHCGNQGAQLQRKSRTERKRKKEKKKGTEQEKNKKEKIQEPPLVAEAMEDIY